MRKSTFEVSATNNTSAHADKAIGFVPDPPPPNDPHYGIGIDFGRLILEWFALAAVTGVVWMFVAKPARSNGDEANRPKQFQSPTGNPEN